MIRLSRTALAVALLALAARTGAAQSITSPIRYIEQKQGLQPFAAYVFTSPTLALTDSTSVDIGPRSAPMFGLAYQLRLSGPLSLQASAGYMASQRDVFLAEASADSATITPIATDQRVNAGILLAEAGFLFHLTGPRAYRGFAPYVGVKGGYARQITGGDPDSSVVKVPSPERFRFGPTFAVGVNAGTDVYVTRTLSLRPELNGRLWRLSAPDGFRNRNQEKLREWSSAASAGIGVVLHF
ncbi:MAG TPA: hypothetical protein VFJ16_07295 [Longimicrobium sp.]|nr:hypothetical protein [Longimicrobium sp.]